MLRHTIRFYVFKKKENVTINQDVFEYILTESLYKDLLFIISLKPFSGCFGVTWFILKQFLLPIAKAFSKTSSFLNNHSMLRDPFDSGPLVDYEYL